MHVKRIVVEKSGAVWDFTVEHETGEAHYHGYGTAEQAVRAVDRWLKES